MPSNERQVGGTHYAGDYQHWDWVADIKLPYHPATAAKYVDRWPNKNSDDLEKAAHYLQKTLELDIVYTPYTSSWNFFWKLVLARGYSIEKAVVLFHIQQGAWALALETLLGLAQQPPANRLASE